MVNLETIITNRKIGSWQSFQIVFEWEDNLCKELSIPLYYKKKIQRNKYVRYAKVIANLLQTTKHAFVYEMFPMDDQGHNKKNIFPCIIDFYLKKEELTKFYKRYKRNKMTFISSREVYEMLVNINAPIKISHLPLSLSDKYTLSKDDRFDKKYDIILAGRQNPVLHRYFQQYITTNPNTSYIYSEFDKSRNTITYKTSDGIILGPLQNRDEYIKTLKKAKIAFYSTPGIDGGESRTNGYNQVTPRFLEFLACGCHIIARYPENPDTRFYELSLFSPNIQNYEQFENRMNHLLKIEVDYSMYAEYLKKHYTSTIANTLKKILTTI